jgi:hypothetical protein
MRVEKKVGATYFEVDRTKEH